MRKIIVAGAGHGGLTAAYHLAKTGYDVTVLESSNRNEMGHDWCDSFSLSDFNAANLPRIENASRSFEQKRAYWGPDCKTRVMPSPVNCYTVDRKILIEHLLAQAENAGAKIVFGAKIIEPLTNGATVCGVKFKDLSGEKIAESDLLIDSAGLYSPVRRQLPDVCGIQNEIEQKDIFYTYRVYLENKTGQELTPSYNVYMFHNNRPGIDWFVTENGVVDILVGKMGFAGKLTDEEIEEALADFKSRYSCAGDKILRGGKKCEIPISKMLPKIVCNGYAAIGDCAGMTVPLNGCGIDLSLKAGKILADTVINAKHAPYTTGVLWSYQYNYYMSCGKGMLPIAVLKDFLAKISGETVNYFINSGILCDESLQFTGSINVSRDYVVNTVKSLPPIVGLLPKMANSFKYVPLMKKINEMMPEEYDRKQIEKWQRMYSKF